MRHLMVDPNLVSPPNEAQGEKLERLIDAMRDGWSGRPLLVKSDGDGYEALTGAHRLAAAVTLGMRVPVLLIEDEDLDFGAWNKLNEESDAEDVLALLCQHGLTQAAEILEQEPLLHTRTYLNFIRRWFANCAV